MAYKRKWDQSVVDWRDIAAECQQITDMGWHVHTIMPTSDVNSSYEDGETVDGAIIVSYFDEPDLSCAVYR
jgi:hypothetical protein